MSFAIRLPILDAFYAHFKRLTFKIFRGGGGGGEGSMSPDPLGGSRLRVCLSPLTLECAPRALWMDASHVSFKRFTNLYSVYINRIFWMRFNLFIVFLFTCKLRASKRSMAIRAGRWDLPAEPEGSGGGGGSKLPRNPGGGEEEITVLVNVCVLV